MTTTSNIFDCSRQKICIHCPLSYLIWDFWMAQMYTFQERIMKMIFQLLPGSFSDVEIYSNYETTQPRTEGASSLLQGTEKNKWQKGLR